MCYANFSQVTGRNVPLYCLSVSTNALQTLSDAGSSSKTLDLKECIDSRMKDLVTSVISFMCLYKTNHVLGELPMMETDNI